MKFLEELAARRRFGMRPGLDAIRGVCAALGDPQKGFRAIHVAGTNGKGAVCAILDAVLGERGTGNGERGTAAAKAMAVEPGNGRIGRYTSPHLVKLNERFFLDGEPIDDSTLEAAANRVSETIQASDAQLSTLGSQLTFFEALTAVAFLIYSEAKVDYAILETGLGGRLDATNVCEPSLCVITRIGLDHCDWLGDTVEKIAAEKAGIIKPGVPVVLGANVPEVRAVVEARAKEVGAPFYYAPDLAGEGEIPEGFSLAGAFNRENAVTAIAALKVLGSIRVDMGRLGSSEPFVNDLGRIGSSEPFVNDLGRIGSSEPFVNDLGRLGSPEAFSDYLGKGFSKVVWPGRFQVIRNFIVDGAHNPPAARALAESLKSLGKGSEFNLIAGFCGDKDVAEVLSILAPFVKKGYAVRTNNPRTLSAEETSAKMREAGMDAVASPSLRSAIDSCNGSDTIICGSLFLAGEALVELGAYPWSATRFDPSELLKASSDSRSGTMAKV